MVKKLNTACCIAGGGPAGMMLGYLLARAGIDVTVLEKHADFLRDFRGDTIHPSTLEVMKELGLLEKLLEQPHQKVREIKGRIGNREYTIADFSHLPVSGKFIAMMPQWDFLSFLSNEAKKYPSFHLYMQAQATDIIQANGVVTGIKALTPDGVIEIKSHLVIGSDGRHSKLRAQAALTVKDMGSPIDVLWMRISRNPSDPEQPIGTFTPGKVFVMIYRGDYWQCAYVIPKGGLTTIQQKTIEDFRANINELAPFLGDRVNEIKTWDDVKLLTVTVDYLKSWSLPGLLCIGDAAHAMSPVGGVGINLAIQDAVAAANILTKPLQKNKVTIKDLQKVQRRREWPTLMTQRLQVMVQNRIIGNVIATTESFTPPWFLKILLNWRFFRRIPAHLIGMGFRPEHMKVNRT